MHLATLACVLALGIAAPAASGSPSPGQLYAFGNNEQGQLGNTTNNDHLVANPTPALVTLAGANGPVTKAASGGGFSMALTSTGQLYAFGQNVYGQLGNATNNEDFFAANPTPTPVTLPGTTDPIADVAAGLSHTLAVTSTGQLYTFGENSFGQLGQTTNNETEAPNPTPMLVTLPGASGPVQEVAAGGYHSLAVTSTGQLYAFGGNAFGELGTATNDDNDPHYTVSNPTPSLVTLPGAGGPVAQIAAGAFFSLAVTSTGQLYAFGENRFGQLGKSINNQTGEPNPTPTLVTLPGASGPVTQVAAGRDHSLALTSTGQLYAFGENRLGQLGNTIHNKTETPNPTPTLVTLPGARGRIIQIAASNDYSLVLTSTGQLYAFGSNPLGELGTPPSSEPGTPHPAPMQVSLPTNIETMATGCCSDHTLAVLADLALTNSPPPSGETNLPYSTQPQATGGVPLYTWSASGLPPGLSIDPANGTISGTPTTTGTYTPTITPTDSDGIEAPTPLTIKIKGPNEPPPPTEEEKAAEEEPAPPPPPPPPPPSHETHSPTTTETLSPPPLQPILLPPSIQHARQSTARWRESNHHAQIGRTKAPTGTTFSFTLNEQATVSFDFLQLPRGHQRTGSCPADTHKSPRHTRCNATIQAGMLSFTGHTGANNMVFAGRLSRTTELKPGRYELIITAANTIGQHSAPVSLSFTITR